MLWLKLTHNLVNSFRPRGSLMLYTGLICGRIKTRKLFLNFEIDTESFNSGPSLIHSSTQYGKKRILKILGIRFKIPKQITLAWL